MIHNKLEWIAKRGSAIAEMLSDKHSEHFDGCSSAVELYLTTVGQAWIDAHPKRALRWIDAMGSHGWLVDGKWIEHSNRLGDERWREAMALLIDSHDWYAEVCDDLGMGALVSDLEFTGKNHTARSV